MKPFFTKLVVLLPIIAGTLGCHDGPLYALKEVNPYFRSQWKADEALGPTDYRRHQELESLAGSIAALEPAEQQQWADDLRLLIENDENPEMRRLAIVSAAQIAGQKGTEITLLGLQDESAKVRQATCRALSRREDPESITALAAVAGSDTNEDVRLAAIKYLSASNSPQAISALKTAVQNPDPAFQNVAIASLRQVTGQDFGSSPEAWVAYLDGKPVPQDDSDASEGSFFSFFR